MPTVCAMGTVVSFLSSFQKASSGHWSEFSMPLTSSVVSSHFFHSWPQSSLCQIMSNWSAPEVSVAVTFSMNTL